MAGKTKRIENATEDFIIAVTEERAITEKPRRARDRNMNDKKET